MARLDGDATGETTPLLAENAPVVGDKGLLQAGERDRRPAGWTIIYRDKDWWSLWLGLLCLGLIVLAVLVAKYDGDPPAPKRWTNRPLEAWESKNGSVRVEAFATVVSAVLVMSTVAYTVLFAAKPLAKRSGGGSVGVYSFKFFSSHVFISLLAGLAWWLAEQDEVHRYGLTFEVWGLALGMLVANTLPACGGPPKWLMSAATGEDYIKVGLVLLGLDVQKIGHLLLPALVTSWVVTPIVILFAYGAVATRLVGIDQSLPAEKRELTASLAMMLAVGLAVCGSSAATAVHGSIPERSAPNRDAELKLTITLLNLMTIVQMIAWPYFAWWVGVPTAVAGAWFGGSLDGTGNVVAAGAIFDELVDQGEGQIGDPPGNASQPIVKGYAAVEVASTVKMLQNALIGPVAIGVTIYWIAKYGAADGLRQRRVPLCHRVGRWALEVWMRFPKFVLGFIIASVVLTVLKMHVSDDDGEQVEKLVVAVRSWWFTIGFVAVGMGTHLPSLARQLRGGKSVVLYLVGQTFDLLITFAAAWAAFTYMYSADDLVEKEK